MTLEDHLGDILRKARTSNNVSVEAAAIASGLTPEEYTSLETSGEMKKRPDFKSLAPLLTLHAGKLDEIANGWLPDPPDLSTWREVRQISTTQGGNTVHCYVVWDEVSREAAIFDTGFDAEPIFQIAGENQLQIRHLFITHSHHDHIAGLAAIRSKFPKIHLHASTQGTPPQHRNRANDFIHLGSLRITNRDTPGHAEDGITYIVGTFPEDAPNVAIVGDAIFAGSMGGARDQLELARSKVKDQILSLPPPTLLCPGHGPLTTVQQERAHNPFFA